MVPLKKAALRRSLREYHALGLDAMENLQQSLSLTTPPLRRDFRALIRDGSLTLADPREIIVQAVNACAPPGGWLPPPEMQARMTRRAGGFFGVTTGPGGVPARDAALPKPEPAGGTGTHASGGGIASPLKAAATHLVGASRRQAGQTPGTAEASARTVYAGHLDRRAVRDRVLALVRRSGTSSAPRSRSRSTEDKEFSEADHPRGQPENAGQFSAAGGAHTQVVKSVAGRQSKTQSQRPVLQAARVGADGKRTAADGSPLPEHIQKLKIPPAWTDVNYSTDPNAALLAVGKDAKGRRQAVYSQAFAATQAAAKFERVDALMRQFDSIVTQNEAGRASTNPKIKDAADCLALIMKMGVRPGSEDDTGADKQAYGATTLQGQHVVSDGKNVSLRFTGKKGVSLNLPVTDHGLAKMLTQRAKKAGPNGQLFPTISDKSLLDYTHTMGDGSFKTKDFRTHLGTRTAGELVNSMPAPKTDKEYKAAVKKVATAVSQKLGNTPTIALQSYINPTVFSAWGVSHAGA